MRKLTLTLNKRKDGRFGKKVDGQYRTWASETEARAELLALIAAREGQAAVVQAITRPADPHAPINTILNHFLSDRETAMRAGQIKPGTFLDYKLAISDFCKELDRMRDDEVMALGRTSPFSCLMPRHFRMVREAWKKRLGSYALDRHIQSVRTALKWAVDPARLVPYPPHYGGEFDKTTRADKRKDRAARERKHGEHRFTAAELKKIIGDAQGQLRCFVLLGLNCGMYAVDIAALKFTDIKEWDGVAVIDTYRQKTQVRQVAPLWSETHAEIKKFLKVRRKKKTIKNPDLIFVTHQGNAWVQDVFSEGEEGVTGGGGIDSIGLMFNRLLVDLEIKREGVGFGAFRHTHVSATAKHPDVNARRVVRGHRVEGIEEHYDFHDLARLKAVTDLAREALLLPAVKRKIAAGQERAPSRAGTSRRKPRASATS